MREIVGVENMHDIHVRTVTSGLVAMSGYGEVTGSRPWHDVLLQINSVMQERFGIGHVTLQPEEQHTLPEALEAAPSTPCDACTLAARPPSSLRVARTVLIRRTPIERKANRRIRLLQSGIGLANLPITHYCFLTVLGTCTPSAKRQPPRSVTATVDQTIVAQSSPVLSEASIMSVQHRRELENVLTKS